MAKVTLFHRVSISQRSTLTSPQCLCHVRLQCPQQADNAMRMTLPSGADEP
jgi:hypothetical protein